MSHELFIAVMAGLSGMLGWGLADFFAKKTINEIGDIATLAWAHICGTIILFVFFIYQFFIHSQHLEFINNFQTWALLLFFGALQAAVYLLVYNGFSKGQIALLSPVFASFSGLVAFFSIVIFGEIVSGYVLLGLVTLFIGILLINLDVQVLKSKRISFTKIGGLKETMSAAALAVIWTLLWNNFVSGHDWLSYALFMYIFMTIAILIVTKIRGINLLVVKASVWKFLVLIGLCEIGAYAGISWGYGTTSMTSIVALLSGAFSLPTILLARIFLKEKISSIQTTGSIVIILSIMVLSAL